jgi:phasin
MSDAAITVDATTNPKAPKNVPPPNAAFEMPKFEMPAAVRDLAEKGGAQAKENYGKMKAATDEMTGMVEATYATAAKAATEYGLKVIEMTRINGNAAFDFIGKLVTVRSPSEAIELSTLHARHQFERVSTQSQELWALVQKIATDVAEPVKAGMSKALQRND